MASLPWHWGVSFTAHLGGLKPTQRTAFSAGYANHSMHILYGGGGGYCLPLPSPRDRIWRGNTCLLSSHVFKDTSPIAFPKLFLVLVFRVEWVKKQRGSRSMIAVLSFKTAPLCGGWNTLFSCINLPQLPLKTTQQPQMKIRNLICHNLP